MGTVGVATGAGLFRLCGSYILRTSFCMGTVGAATGAGLFRLCGSYISRTGFCMGTGLAALGAGLFALGGILRTNRIFRLVLFFLLSLLLSLRRGEVPC